MIAGVGIYSASPEGVTMLPTYLTFAGFNGGMDLLQLIQMYQGVMPIYLLPFQCSKVQDSQYGSKLHVTRTRN